MTTRDPADALLGAIEALVGPISDVERNCVPWMSATFAGARHVLSFSAVGYTPDFAGVIAEREIVLRHGFVADVAVVSVEATAGGHRIVVEALTIDD